MRLYASNAWMSRSARRHSRAHRPIGVALDDLGSVARKHVSRGETARSSHRPTTARRLAPSFRLR